MRLILSVIILWLPDLSQSKKGLPYFKIVKEILVSLWYIWLSYVFKSLIYLRFILFYDVVLVIRYYLLNKWPFLTNLRCQISIFVYFLVYFCFVLFFPCHWLVFLWIGAILLQILKLYLYIPDRFRPPSWIFYKNVLNILIFVRILTSAYIGLKKVNFYLNIF